LSEEKRSSCSKEIRRCPSCTVSKVPVTPHPDLHAPVDVIHKLVHHLLALISVPVRLPLGHEHLPVADPEVVPDLGVDGNVVSERFEERLDRLRTCSTEAAKDVKVLGRDVEVVAEFELELGESEGGDRRGLGQAVLFADGEEKGDGVDSGVEVDVQVEAMLSDLKEEGRRYLPQTLTHGQVERVELGKENEKVCESGPFGYMRRIRNGQR
jgi:hypothetical protein